MVSSVGETEALFLSDLSESERNDRSDLELRQIAFEYERDQDNRAMRSMARRGTLDWYLDNKIRMARDYAQNLMSLGDSPDAAWNQAIRVCLLEREE